MSISTFRQNRLDRLFKRDGQVCHYCRQGVHLRVMWLAEYRQDDATLDHIVPRSKSGSNGLHNLVVACRKCNEAKDDRDYADFVGRPYRLPLPELVAYHAKRSSAAHAVKRNVKSGIPGMWPCSPLPNRHRIVKKHKGGAGHSLAAAIERGEVVESGGAYKRPNPIDVRLADSKYRIMEPCSVEMTQRILREGGKAKQDLNTIRAMDWPWLRELVKPLVSTVGFGPW